MSGDTMTKVLDIEGAFESRSKESAKGSNERRKARHQQKMQVIRSIRNRSDSATKLGDIQLYRLTVSLENIPG